jgi:hypothetical protein
VPARPRTHDRLRLQQVDEVLARIARQQGVAYVDAVERGWRVGGPALPAQLAAAIG